MMLMLLYHVQFLCACILWCSRKERLCNGCFVEHQRDQMMTSDTETDSDPSTSPQHAASPISDNTLIDHDTLVDQADRSPQHECSPISDNTLLEQADTADDSTLQASSSDAAVSTVDGDDVMSRSAPAAYNSSTWSMRDSAYSAMSWVSGVVSRSFVRPTGNHKSTDEHPAAEGNVEVDVAAADAVDINSQETVSPVLSDTQPEDVNLTLNDSFSPDVVVSDILSAGQSVPTPRDNTETVLTCADITDNIEIQPSLSPDSTTTDEICQSLQPDDTAQR